MILAFKHGTIPVLFGIGKDRELSIATPVTKYLFTRIEDLSKFKKFSDSELIHLKDTTIMVKGFDSMVSVKSYVISEMGKLGLVFSREMSLVEYESIAGII